MSSLCVFNVIIDVHLAFRTFVYGRSFFFASGHCVEFLHFFISLRWQLSCVPLWFFCMCSAFAVTHLWSLSIIFISFYFLSLLLTYNQSDWEPFFKCPKTITVQATISYLSPSPPSIGVYRPVLLSLIALFETFLFSKRLIAHWLLVKQSVAIMVCDPLNRWSHD